MHFNKEQIEAINSNDTPTILVAGAGSGKTFTLTQRINYLVNDIGYDPNSILCFTFTNKAANEIKKRVLKNSSFEDFKWLGTFHSICLKILRYEHNLVSREKNFLIIDEEEKEILIKEIYLTKNLSKEILNFKKTINFISLIKNNGPKEIEEKINEELSTVQSEMLIEIYEEYKRKMIKNNIFDFDDLINETISIFNNNNEIKKKWQNRFNYILVDEFQDTNKKQLELIKLLSKNKKNIFVVGDPDQTIYTWRGAYPNIFEDFKEFFGEYNQIILNKNYRSTKKILNVSNQLISNNEGRIKKELITDNVEGRNILYYHAKDESDESDWITKNIKNLINNGYKYSDILILYRSNLLSRNIEQELILNSIPYKIFGGFKFFQRKEIKDIIAYLKLIVSNDDLSFSRIYNIPKRNLGITSYNKVLVEAETKNKSVSDLIFDIDLINGLDKTKKLKFKELSYLILYLREIKKTSILEYIDLIIEKINYYDYLKEIGEEKRILNIEQFREYVSKYQETNNVLNLSDFLQEISLYTDEEKNIDKSEYVSLMTIHSAKGLEFKNVFIISMNEGNFPSFLAKTSKDILEERRLFYVALTRAEDSIFVSSSSGRILSNIGWIDKNPSRFIKEIENEAVEMKINEEYKIKEDFWKRNNSLEKEQKIDVEKYFVKNKNISFDKGEQISHEIFGLGLIKEIQGDIITVDFGKEHGKKTLMKNHKAIKKI